ncbi:MAG: F0F1 ATP synthase subunit epsilon [Novosphingobium sp.]|nr:F0F1 ATP synthase subunit epsilon [Novosphingobium sp.]
MTGRLELVISTPSRVLVQTDDVRSLRASDASGGFGIQPGHADFLTAIPASVVQWRESDDQWRYCVVRGGVLSVSNGKHIALACRKGLLGNDLASLADEVREASEAQTDSDRRARVEQTRLHAQAVRQLVSYLMPRSRGAGFERQVEADE